MNFKNWLMRGMLVAAALTGATASYAAPPAGWTKVANEKSRFTLTASTPVAYGADSSFVTKTMPAGSTLCGNLAFLSDPKPGKVKACYANLEIPSGTAPVSGTVLAKEDKFSLPAPTVVTFGAGGPVITKTLVAGNYRCGVDLFVTDPAPGQVKTCTSLGAPTSNGSGGTGGTTPVTPPTGPGPYLATQGSSFTLTATTVVSYGVNGAYVDATLAAGSRACANATFPSDPAPNSTKYCYSKGAPPTTGTPTGVTAWTMQRLSSPFTLTGTQVISYGSATGKGEKPLDAGTYTCDATTFSTVGDPAPGVTKFCEAISLQPETKLVDAGSSFTLTTAKIVIFGKNGFFNQKSLAAGTYACTTSVFGDPAAGNTYGNGGINSCFVPGSNTAPTNPSDPAIVTAPPVDVTPTVTANTTPQAVKRNSIAGRGNFTIDQPTKIIYGDEDGPFNEFDLTAGTYVCNNTGSTFGDPEPGTEKSCQVIESGNNTALGAENTNFTLTETQYVAFGSKGKYNKAQLVAGTYSCSTAVFGSPAGATGTRNCVAIKNPKRNLLNANGPQDALILTNGVVDATKYRAVAATFGTDTGIDYRFGPTSAYYGTTSNSGRPNYAARPTFSDMGTATDGQGNHPNCLGTGACPKYSFGPLKNDYLDYSSSGLQVTSVPDAVIDPAFYKKPYWGVSNFLGLSMSYGTYSPLPQISWTMTEGYARNGGDNDYNMDRYTDTMEGRPSWVPKITSDFKPIASSVCTSHSSWCTNTLTVWKNGDITASGGNTNHNYLTYNFLNGDTTKVPTAINITGSGEFALITVWDTANIKGQIAVVALAEGCQGCDPTDERTVEEGGTWYRNWGNWRQLYHGLPGKGNYLSMKLIGYVDLPSNVKAPTAIASTTGVPWYNYDHSGEWGEPLDVEYNRRSYFAPVGSTPENLDHSAFRSVTIARSGMATVISKSEKTVAFVDLQPLFNYYRQQYFGQSQSGFNAMIANRGTGASQWPYTFANTPSQTPVVVKTVTLTDAPTAVAMPNFGVTTALVATRDGTGRVYGFGTGYVNNTTATTGVASDITEKFTISGLGRNVTSVAIPVEHGWETHYDTSTYSLDGTSQLKVENYLIASSRGDRKVNWIKFNDARTSATISKTLTDSKIIDPIGINDAQNHGTESYLLNIADYAGRGVHAYMYGAVIMHTHNGDGVGCAEDNGLNAPRGGCNLLDNLPFEYGGFKATPGQPFDVKGQNIN